MALTIPDLNQNNSNNIQYTSPRINVTRVYYVTSVRCSLFKSSNPKQSNKLQPQLTCLSSSFFPFKPRATKQHTVKALRSAFTKRSPSLSCSIVPSHNLQCLVKVLSLHQSYFQLFPGNLSSYSKVRTTLLTSVSEVKTSNP